MTRCVFLVAWGALRRELERTVEYQDFRRAVLERDRFVCQSCGGPGHVVHHRRRVARAVHLALDPRNAEVRCEDCHREEHPYWLRRAS